MSQLLDFTAAAIRESLKALAEFGEEGDFLRVTVLGGGLSGLQYSLDFDHEEHPADAVMRFDDLKIVVDAVSAEWLRGTTVDYVEAPEGTGFRFRRPDSC